MNSIEAIKGFSLSRHLTDVVVCDGKYVVPLILTDASIFVTEGVDKERDEEIMNWWVDKLIEDGYHSFQTTCPKTIRGFYTMFNTTDNPLADIRNLLLECEDFYDVKRHLVAYDDDEDYEYYLLK